MSEEIEIVGFAAGERRKKVVTGVEMFRKLLDEGRRLGDNIGCVAAGDGEGRRGAGAGVGEAGVDHTRTRSLRAKCTC